MSRPKSTRTSALALLLGYLSEAPSLREHPSLRANLERETRRLMELKLAPEEEDIATGRVLDRMTLLLTLKTARTWGAGQAAVLVRTQEQIGKATRALRRSGKKAPPAWRGGGQLMSPPVAEVD